MKSADRYLRYVLWSEEDQAYIGYCPDLFPWGGVCHADSETEAYTNLCALVIEEVEELEKEGRPLPFPSARPMRDAVAS
jgi:hypothetical protein